MNRAPVVIDYYSDLLCVWAYVAQVRVDEIQQEFGEKVIINHHFFSLFGDTTTRLEVGWKDRGGFSGFHDHVAAVCDQHPHCQLHPDVWKLGCQPASSAVPHLMIQAIQVLVADAVVDDQRDATGKTRVERIICAIRRAFFEQGKNIGQMDVLWEIIAQFDVPRSAVEQVLNDGRALARHALQNEKRYSLQLEGSPTFILDGGRQKLFGNVGYRVIQANIEQLLRDQPAHMSWC
jgi:predicted DsbA family dithiol-disulfide isomerase